MSKIAFIFPGQASQFVGMGKDIFENYEFARKIYQRADDVLGMNISDISFHGPQEKLNQTEFTQPAIFILSVILTKILNEKGLSPHIVAGHSLGEYAALVAAGVVDFEDALKIVVLRGQLMQKAGAQNPGTMAAILGLDSQSIELICRDIEGQVQIANYNSPSQIVISGSHTAVQKVIEISKQKGAKLAKKLPVSGAFHSPLMQPAVLPFSEQISSFKFSNATIPLIPNVKGTIEVEGSILKECLIKQLTGSVYWTATINEMLNNGVDTFWEVGPGKVLQRLVKSIDKNVTTKGISKLSDLD